MSRAPYIPIFIGDYVADTQHLSLDEHGAYLLLLFHCWQMGSIPRDDDARICRILSIDAERWQAIKPTILGFFQPDGTHKRVEKVRAYHARRSTAGKAAAEARWGNRTQNADAKRMRKPCDDASKSHPNRIPDRIYHHTNNNNPLNPPPDKTDETGPSPPQSDTTDKTDATDETRSKRANPRAKGTNPRAVEQAEEQASLTERMRVAAIPAVLPAEIQLGERQADWEAACNSVRELIGDGKWDAFFDGAKLVSLDPPRIAVTSQFKAERMDQQTGHVWRERFSGLRFITLEGAK